MSQKSSKTLLWTAIVFFLNIDCKQLFRSSLRFVLAIFPSTTHENVLIVFYNPTGTTLIGISGITYTVYTIYIYLVQNNI